ncbi:MAG: AAA family ATPase [Rubrobacter sp.]|nr:AAA family ATPase [Rubrobacter sp.]
MPRTNIFLLGSPRVERDGEAVEADTRKATALVAYLAVGGSPARRDTLADLLWPEHGQKKARAALRRTLSALGGARSEGWLVVDRENISLANDETFVDVNRFRELLEERKHHGHSDGEVCAECVGPLSEAAGIYRGDFMAGFALRDSAVFDDWQFFHGEELRRELSSALEKLSRAEAASGDFERAVSHARRRLELDRLDESSHRKLMEIYSLSGQRTAALRQFEECSKTLEKELGIAPAEVTKRLYEAIKTNAADELPPPPELSEYHSAATEGGSIVREGSLPGALAEKGEAMVGREAEWEKLAGAYEGARSGGWFVALEGEAGVGKTRLAEEFSRHVAGRGAATVAVRCHPDEAGLAYGPFAEALSSLAGGAYRGKLENVPEHHLGEAARLAPALGEAPPTSESPGARSRFFEGVAQTFAAVLEGSGPTFSEPGVLFVDDAHWADEASLEFLSYLARRIGDRKVCVICAWRGDLVPESHALRRLLAAANRARMSASIHIPRLDRESVERLVKSAVVGEAPELGGRIYGETEGLPLLVAEYLAAMENGEIEAKDEIWPLPGGARDLLRERISALGESERRTLGAAAVIGHSFDLGTLRESSGGDEEEVISALEGLERRGLIEGVDDGSLAYDFAHEKLRSLVYEETSLARRRLLHRRVAESLARSPGSGASPARVARHYEMAGMESEAAEYFGGAGEAHRSLYANAEALSNFRSALALGHADEAGIHESIGDVLTLTGEYEAAIRSFASAKEERHGGDLARLERKLGGLRHRRGEWERAGEHYETALGVLEGAVSGGGLGEKARLFSEMGLLARSRGDLRSATEYSEAALGLAGEAGDALSLARTHNVAAIVSRSGGDLRRAREHLEHSLEFSETFDDPGICIAALNNLALVLGESGDEEEAIAVIRQALELCVASGDRHHEAALRNNLADLLHKMGREEEAMEALKEAVGIFAEIGGEGDWQPEIWKLAEW